VVKIRLKRMGTTKRPVYRLVVADSRSPRDGRFIEEIGFYDPLPDPAVVRIDEEKVKVWMRRGARPSDTARDLLVRQGILAAPPRVHRAKPAPEAAAAPAVVEAVAEPEAAAVSEPVVETEAKQTAGVEPATETSAEPAEEEGA
jgi:small subunit ribosomal protein S16